MSKPRVSIGVPAYNAEGFLPDTLDSVLEQDYGDFELIISDNGSTDRTQEIGRSYAAQDGRIRYLRNERNIGLARNFNRLVEESQGEYFKWLASDDMIAGGYLHQCVEFLEKEESVVLVTAKILPVEASGEPVAFDAVRNIFVTSYGEEFPPLIYPAEIASPRASLRFQTVLRDLKDHVSTAYVYGVYRSEAIKQTSLFQYFLGCDKALLAELSLLGRFHLLPGELFILRMRSDRVGLASAREGAKVMDPERSRIAPPEADRIPAYLRMIRAAPMPKREKAVCITALMQYVSKGSIDWMLRNAALLSGRVRAVAQHGSERAEG